MALTTGQRVIRFIEKYLVIPEGDDVGKPVRLLEFQKLFILEVFDNPHGTKKAILSIARKNAKTALIAFIVIAFLVGPIAKRNSRIASGALALKQAAEVFKLAKGCVELSPKIRDLIHIHPSGKMLTGKLMGTTYSALSAEAKTAHGNSLRVVIIDEPGQVIGPTSEFFKVLTTSQAAYRDAITFYIGTQASTDADFFSLLIDDALKNKPLKTVCHLHTAPKDCEIMDEAAWYAANPALGKFRSMEDMREQAEIAARMPSEANMFRNLNLNQRVSIFSPMIPVDYWKMCQGQEVIPPGVGVYVGLDLSQKTDLTSATITAVIDDVLYAETYFWAPQDGVAERSKRDRVDYQLWADQGYLFLTPGSTVDYEYVAEQLAGLIGDRELILLGFDRWRIDSFKKACEHQGIVFEMVPVIQGPKTLSPAIEDLEGRFMGLTADGRRKFQQLENPVQTMCAANVTAVKDASGMRKPDKSKSTGRIDGIVSLLNAIAARLSTVKTEEKHDFSNYKPIIIRRKK